MPSAIGAANISGLASGINFNDVVDKLMAVENRKVGLLKASQQTEIAQQNALTTLNSDILSLRTQAQNLANSSNFFVNASTLASDTATDPATLLKVTPSSTATTGTHTVKIDALAAAEKLGSSAAIVDANTSSAVISTTTALGLTGSFQVLGKASAAQTVSVSGTDSIQDVVNAINALNSGANATGVTASILTVNSTSGSEDFRVVLSADNTGTTATTQSGRIGEILVDTSGDLANAATLGKLNLNPANTAIELQTSANASLTVDAVSGITRDTNTITDVIPGITLDLLKKDSLTTTMTITTAVDQTAVKSKLQSFVDGYNKIMTFINDQMAFDANTNTSGLLSSDATVRSIQTQLSSNILKTIPGLKSDRNNMVLIGVSPDSTGQLVIDDTKLSNLLSTDPTAVRDVFSATGTGSTASLQFLTFGTGTVSGDYAVNITQAAAKANILGTADLSAGIGSGNTDTVTLTDASGRQTTMTFNGSGATGSDKDGSSISAIVSALNTEFGTTYTEKRQMNTALITGTSSASTSATLLNALTDGTNNLNVAANDSITITGTKRNGNAVTATFNVLDPSTDTVGDLLSSIQAAFDQQVTATIDPTGKITLTDNTEGDSQLSFSLSSSNSALDARLGTDTVVTEGRFAMQLSAASSSNQLQIQADNFGSGSNFSVTQSTDYFSFGSLSIGTGTSGQPATTTSGANVTGTIDGLAASGTNQTLTGTDGNVNGLALLYTGSSTGSIGNILVSLGVGATYDNLLDTFTNPAIGLILNDVSASQTTVDNLQTQIDNQTARIEQERNRLIKSFQQMETLISGFKTTGQFLTQQLNPPQKQ